MQKKFTSRGFKTFVPKSNAIQSVVINKHVMHKLTCIYNRPINVVHTQNDTNTDGQLNSMGLHVAFSVIFWFCEPMGHHYSHIPTSKINQQTHLVCYSTAHKDIGN